MNENQVQASVLGQGQSPGALMRTAREQSGLHIAALAVTLKVPVKRLEALEADRYDLLPDSVFTRALAASVCRSLKLDAAPILALLPQPAQHELVVDGSLNQPLRAQTGSASAGARAAVSRPALIAAALVLLAAAAVHFLPDLSFLSKWSVSTVGNSSAEVTEYVAPARGAEVAAATPAPSPVPPLVAGPSPSAPPPATPPAPTSAMTAIAPALGDGSESMLTFNAQRNSWVEVVDASGAVLLRRTLAAGEQVPVAGKPVLRVVVGNAGGVQVKVRGQDLDLKTLAQDNVARFEVK